MKYVRALFLTLTIATLGLHAQPLNTAPNRVLGQDTTALNNLNPNLVEGKEFYRPQGLALDTTSTPPGLYVADTINNRVLGFRNAAAFTNGQQADIVLGQPDFVTTNSAGPNRPGSIFSTGLTTPTGLAVDSKGNLYVVDSGNNRVLRFPTPFTKTTQLPDLAIGQPGFSTRTANTGGASASSLNFNPGDSAYAAGLAFDAEGNLWVADPLNNRVLRFPVAVLGADAANGPAADLVLGQSSFSSTAGGPTDPANFGVLNIPSSVAFDSTGRLFVLESVTGVHGRVLVYTSPFATGQAATRVLGGAPSPVAAPINDSQLGSAPGDLFIYGNDNVGVTDTSNHRILLFKPVDQWTSDVLTQQAIGVIGQPDFTSGLANRGFGETDADRFQTPTAAAATGDELYVADSGNHRVVVLPLTATSFGVITRVLGQNAVNFNAPNLVEGRELDFTVFTPSGLVGDAGLAIDTKSTPAHLYIADTYNNRVLGYRDFRSMRNGAPADLIIGQVNLLHTLVNAPGGDPGAPTATGLNQPVALALDPAGNLYVADRGNGRVLRYPSPFTNPGPATPDLVLGQSSFTRLITDPSAATMAAPSGLAFSSTGALLVSDSQLNRVLYFSGPSTGFTSGMAATKVFGQSNFTGIASGNADNRLNNPYAVAIDNADRLYIADAGNNRVAIYDNVTNAVPDAHQALALVNLKDPRGVYVSPSTNEIFVADTGNNQVLRYPTYETLPAVNYTPSAALPEYSPRAVVVDLFGNLYIADLANRVLIYYHTLAFTNGANFLQEPYGPGTFLSIFGASGQFGADTASFSTIPVPTTLANLQVLVNNKPAPVYFVSPAQINFLLPMTTSTSGTADVEVVRSDTGQVLGDSAINLGVASPGLFATGGSGQIAALNQDNTVNSSTNPAVVGSVLQIFGTGQGFVPNAPPDGTPPTGLTPSLATPLVLMYQGFVPPANVQYSGLAPSLVGVWQINVLIPALAVPVDKTSAQIPCVVLVNSIPSGGAILGRTTTIWVKR